MGLPPLEMFKSCMDAVLREMVWWQWLSSSEGFVSSVRVLDLIISKISSYLNNSMIL